MRNPLEAASTLLHKKIKVEGNKNRADPLDRMLASKLAAEIRGYEVVCILCSPRIFDFLAQRFKHKLGFVAERFVFENTLIIKDERGITKGRDFDLVCQDAKNYLRLINKN